MGIADRTNTKSMKYNAMQRTNKRARRIMASLLIAVMLFSVLLTALNGSIERTPGFGAAQGLTRAADADTTDSYIDRLLSNGWGSRYAGRLWADKSVFESGFSLGLDMVTDGYNGFASAGSNSDFLHVFSVLASSIYEQGATPLDVVFILDVSNSMNYTKDYTPGVQNNIDDTRIEIAASALDQCIDAIMNSSRYNRVALVAFSGNDGVNVYPDAGNGAVLLKLGRYVKSNDKYISATSYAAGDGRLFLTAQSEDGNDANVWKRTGNITTDNPEYFRVAGATNTQLGLYMGMDLLASEKSTTVDTNGDGIEEQRQPVVILISDGQPTVSSGDVSSVNGDLIADKWWQPEVSSLGDGTQSLFGNAILALATASYMKNMINMNYEIESEVYTFGVDIVNLPANWSNSDGLKWLLDNGDRLGRDNHPYGKTGHYTGNGQNRRYVYDSVIDQEDVPESDPESVKAARYLAAVTLNPELELAKNDTYVAQQINEAWKTYIGQNNTGAPSIKVFDVVTNAADDWHFAAPNSYRPHRYGENPIDYVRMPHPTTGYDIDTLEYVKKENFRDVTSDNLAQELFKVTEDLLNFAFTPVSGNNSLGVGNSVTYIDPIGEYMEVKDGSVNAKVNGTDMSLLLFGEMRSLYKAAIYDFSFNDAYMTRLGKQYQEFTSGWYSSDDPETAEYLPGGGSWEAGNFYYVDYATAIRVVPTLDENGDDGRPIESPENLSDKQKNTVYTFYRFAEDSTVTSLWRFNPAYIGRTSDVKTTDYGTDYSSLTEGKYIFNNLKQTEFNELAGNGQSVPTGAYRLSDFRIWIEDTGDYDDENPDGELFAGIAYEQALYMNIPSNALPIQMADILAKYNRTSKVDEYTYTTNLGADNVGSDQNDYYKQSTPLRLFYAVGLQDKIISDDRTGIDLAKVSENYINSHRDKDNKIYFLSNYFTGDKYDDGAEQRKHGDPVITFSPSSQNRYYIFQKALKLYSVAYQWNGTEFVEVRNVSDLKDDGNSVFKGEYESLEQARTAAALTEGNVIFLSKDYVQNAVAAGESYFIDIDYYRKANGWQQGSTDAEKREKSIGVREQYVIGRSGAEFLADEFGDISESDMLCWINTEPDDLIPSTYSVYDPELPNAGRPNVGNWVVATNPGGLRTTDLSQSVVPKGNGNNTETAANVYMPSISHNSSSNGNTFARSKSNMSAYEENEANISAADIAVYANVLPSNLAPGAEPSASFTATGQSQVYVGALNDGRYSLTNSSFTPDWNSWRNNPQTTEFWVQYDWSEDVVISSIKIVWFDDNGGVKVPASAYIQYSTDGVNWNNVTGASEFKFNRTGFEEITFDKVTACSLRLNMTRKTSYNDSANGVGIQEWEVYGVYAKDLVDKSELEDLFDKAKDLDPSGTDSGLADALEKANGVLGNDDATQKDVDDALKNLRDAINDFAGVNEGNINTGVDALINVRMGNNGRISIDNTELLVTKRVADETVAGINADKVFSYQIFIQGFTGTRNAIIVKWDEAAKIWRRGISTVDILTSNNGLLRDKAYVPILVDGEGRIDPDGEYYVYVVNESYEEDESGEFVVRIYDSGSTANGSENRKTDGTLQYMANTVYLVPKNNVTDDWSFADDPRSSEYDSISDFIIAEMANVDATGRSSGGDITSDYAIRTTYQTVTLEFGLADQDELFDNNTFDSIDSDTIRKHTAQFTLKHGEGLLFNGINFGSSYRVTEKLTQDDVKSGWRLWYDNEKFDVAVRHVRQNSYIDYDDHGRRTGFWSGNDGETAQNTAMFDLDNHAYSVFGRTGAQEEAVQYVNTRIYASIEITKEVDSAAVNPKDTFKFSVEITDAVTSEPISGTYHAYIHPKNHTVTDSDGEMRPCTPDDHPHTVDGDNKCIQDITFASGTATVTLNKDQTCVITGLPQGAEYKVSEIEITKADGASYDYKGEPEITVTDSERDYTLDKDGISVSGYLNTSHDEDDIPIPSVKINYTNSIYTCSLSVTKIDTDGDDKGHAVVDFAFVIKITLPFEWDGVEFNPNNDCEAVFKPEDDEAMNEAAVIWTHDTGNLLTWYAGFSLRHNWTLEIQNLPMGTLFEVTEIDPSGHYLKQILPYPGVEDIVTITTDLKARTASGRLPTEAYEDMETIGMTFYNDPILDLPSVGGIGIGNYYLICSLLIVCAVGCFIAFSRKQRD